MKGMLLASFVPSTTNQYKADLHERELSRVISFILMKHFSFNDRGFF